MVIGVHVAALFGAVFTLTAGCGGIVSVAGPTAGDGATTGSGGADKGAAGRDDSGAGGRGSSISDSAAIRSRACRDYFAVQFSQPCSGPELPPSELSRLASLFEQSCAAEFDRPGNNYDADALAACVKALRIAGCDSHPIECDFRGSLPEGAPCITGTQCRSGECTAFTPGSDGSGITTCGTCRAVARVGEVCSEAACEKGAECDNTAPWPAEPHYVCRAAAEVGLAEPCDGQHWCKTGLYCNESRKVCERPPAMNERCPAGVCAASLACYRGYVTETDFGNTVCGPPGNAGDSCDGAGDRGCASGLGCVWNDGDASNRCLPLHWVGPGEVCDDTHRCLVRSCPRPVIHYMGTCPRTVADGQPCTSDDECDTLSRCFNPTTSEGAATGICEPMSRVICGR